MNKHTGAQKAQKRAPIPDLFYFKMVCVYMYIYLCVGMRSWLQVDMTHLTNVLGSELYSSTIYERNTRSNH